MRARQERWPVQSRAEYAMKALKCAAALLLSSPPVYGFVMRGDRDPGTLVRTIPPGDEAAFVAWLRRHPCGGLSAMLGRRLKHFPTERVRRQVRAGEHLASGLPLTFFRPGTSSRQATQWLFPVVTDDPDRLIQALRAAGFDATQATSQIRVVAPEPPAAHWLMAGIVFVPAYPEIPARERMRLARVLRVTAAASAAARPQAP